MLDEMFAPQIGQLLHQDGIDCVSVADDRLLCAQDDATILAAALEQGRALVTNNVIDFEPLPPRPAVTVPPCGAGNRACVASVDSAAYGEGTDGGQVAPIANGPADA